MLHECSKCGKRRKTHICVRCNKSFCEKHIEFSPDPYAADVYNDDTPVWECCSCRVESAQDI